MNRPLYKPPQEPRVQIPATARRPNIAFINRIGDTLYRLSIGESKDTIREVHGSVVVRTACNR